MINIKAVLILRHNEHEDIKVKPEIISIKLRSGETLKILSKDQKIIYRPKMTHVTMSNIKLMKPDTKAIVFYPLDKLKRDVKEVALTKVSVGGSKKPRGLKAQLVSCNIHEEQSDGKWIAAGFPVYYAED